MIQIGALEQVQAPSERSIVVVQLVQSAGLRVVYKMQLLEGLVRLSGPSFVANP